MEPNLYDYVHAEMQKLPRKEWQAVADESGVKYGTLYRYAHRYVERPAYDPLTKIAAALKARAA